MAFLAHPLQDLASGVESEPVKAAAWVKAKVPALVLAKAGVLAGAPSGLAVVSVHQPSSRESSHSIRKKPARPVIKEQSYSRQSCAETVRWISSASCAASVSVSMRTPFKPSNSGDSGPA